MQSLGPYHLCTGLTNMIDILSNLLLERCSACETWRAPWYSCLPVEKWIADIKCYCCGNHLFIEDPGVPHSCSGTTKNRWYIVDCCAWTQEHYSKNFYLSILRQWQQPSQHQHTDEHNCSAWQGVLLKAASENSLVWSLASNITFMIFFIYDIKYWMVGREEPPTGPS